MVNPKLTTAIEFLERTNDRLRHASFVRLTY